MNKNETTMISLNKLVLNTGQIDGVPKNPRIIKDERFAKLKQSIQDFPEMLGLRELLVFPYNDKFVVLGGNMRLKVLQELGYMEAPCKIIPEQTPVERLREIIIKDNIAYGEDDYDILRMEWSLDELEEWGMDTANISQKEEEQSKYTKNIEAPVYEVTGEKPSIDKLTDTTKFNALVSSIDTAEISNEEKEFLRLAAYRHVVFDYEKIAEFYAHAEPDTQVLMEESALVIIDYNSAIENGFVILSKDIAEQYAEDHE